MASNVATLISSTTAPVTGGAQNLPANSTNSALVQAYLDADGGTATVVLQGRLSATSKWKTLATFTLSGANASDEWVIENESWFKIRANVTAISGTGAQATAEVGY